MNDALITVEALAKQLNNLVLLDASMPRAARFITGAQCFDVDDISDHTSPYPHMLPNAATFEARARELGINADSHVVVYDSTGISFAAARVWWMFRVFGHTNIQVLNGGLPAWVMAGGATQTAPAPHIGGGTFTAHYSPALYRSYDDVVRISEDNSEQIVDVRGAGRFNALTRTIDGDVVPGHIQNSVNLPFAAVLDPMGGAMLGADNLNSMLETHLPNTHTKRVISCGSGITACVVALALYQNGEPDAAVFDGSWIEWSDREGLR